MKKIFVGAAVTAVLLAMGACEQGKADSADEAVRTFAQKFAATLQDGNTDSLSALYPQITAADSLVSGLVNDSITVKGQPGAPGTYLVSYGNRAQITVVTGADGTLSVQSSRGLFAYAPARLETARKFGQYNDSLSDAENAERMAETSFLERLVPDFARRFKEGVRVGISNKSFNPDSFLGSVDIVVTNNTDADLDGSDYAVTFYTEEPMGYSIMSPDNSGTRIRKGVTVKAGQKASIHYVARDIVFFDVHDLQLQWNATDRELFEHYYKATGREYDMGIAKK